jgi:protein TonB
MPHVSAENRDRAKSAAGVALFHALLAYVFLTGLGAEVVRSVEAELKTFDVWEKPPPPPAIPPPDREQAKKPRPKDPEGAAAPPNKRDTPTPVVAPPPEIRLPIPPPIPVAPVAGQGNAPKAGAAELPGPGTGSGGIGNGTGSGMYGSGTGGGGGGGGRAVRARLIRGGIDPSDYPRRAFEARRTGTVYLRFVVAPDGRVSDCAVTRSSGTPELDATTCRLILRRFRYRPARDASGQPIAEVVRGQHEWELGPEPEPIDIEPTIPD